MDVYVMHFREKKVFIVPLQPDSTVLDLKNALAEKYGVSNSQIKLIFKSSILNNDEELVIAIDFEEKFPITCFIKPGSSSPKPQQTSQLSTKTPQQTSQLSTKTPQPPSQPKEPEPASPSSPPQINPDDELKDKPIHEALQSPQNVDETLQPDNQILQTADQVPEVDKDAMNEYNALLKDPITSLCSYGFSREQVEEALRICQNNAAWAQELLLSGDVSMNGLQNLIKAQLAAYPNSQNYQAQVVTIPNSQNYQAQVVTIPNSPNYQGQVIAIPNSPNYKTQVVRKGNKFYVLATYHNDQEENQLIQNLMQIYNEMDETDKQNVNILKNEGVHIADAIFAYIQNQSDIEAARKYISALKQQAQTQYAYIVS